MISARLTIQSTLGSQKWQLGEERGLLSTPSAGFTAGRADRSFPQPTENQTAPFLSLGSPGGAGRISIFAPGASLKGGITTLFH